MAELLRLEDSKSSIKLNKGITGSYGWEIKVYDDSPDKALTEIEKIDATLKAKYGNSNGVKK